MRLTKGEERDKDDQGEYRVAVDLYTLLIVNNICSLIQQKRPSHVMLSHLLLIISEWENSLKTPPKGWGF